MCGQVHLLVGSQIRGHEEGEKNKEPERRRKKAYRDWETTTFSCRVPKVKKQELIDYVAVKLAEWSQGSA